MTSPISCFCNLLFILGQDEDTSGVQNKIKLQFEMYACPATSKETVLLSSSPSLPFGNIRHKPAHVSSNRAEHNMSYTVEHFTVVPLRFRGIKNKLSVKPDVYTTALISVAQL